MIMILLAVACAMYSNKPQTGVKPPFPDPQLIYKSEADIPIGPCAFVATFGAPAYLRPVESPVYEVARLNWGAFPVVDDSLISSKGGWVAIATDIGPEADASRRSILFVRASNITSDLSLSTMSPGDIAESDWSLCTNAPE